VLKKEAQFQVPAIDNFTIVSVFFTYGNWLSLFFCALPRLVSAFMADNFFFLHPQASYFSLIQALLVYVRLPACLPLFLPSHKVDL
jgi:hypothetical protein